MCSSASYPGLSERIIDMGILPGGPNLGPIQTQNAPVPLDSSKMLVIGLALVLILLLLVDHFPRVIIGFSVLVLIGVILAHASTVTNFFNVGQTENETVVK